MPLALIPGGTLLVILSAAGFATLAIFLKFAYAAGTNLMTILAFRFIVAALFLGLVLRWRGISLLLDAGMTLRLLAMGALGYGSMAFLFAASLYYLPASLSAMLLYTYPAIVSLLSFALGDERFTETKGTALTLCLAGLVLVLGTSFTGIHPVGVLLSLGAAVSYSCYIVVGSRLLKNVNCLLATFYVCSAAALVFTVIGLLTDGLQLVLPLSTWLILLGIAVFPTIIGVLCFFAGLSRVGATNASMISTLEPIITIFLSVALLGERITPLQMGGGLLILGGIIILQLWPGKRAA
jgi:drug/metabolite transporter (DMT)-like permease